MQYVNDCIAERISAVEADSVLDLGCGVGGSMLYLSRHNSLQKQPAYYGVTLSPVQAGIAEEVLSQGVEGPTWQILCGDYTLEEHWPSEQVNLAYAIESSIHVAAFDRACAIAARRIASGGEFVICDDFLVPDLARARDSRLLEAFRKGWYAYGLRSVQQCSDLADAAGFDLVQNTDFSSYLELDRPRDLLARAFLGLFGWWPWRGPWLSNIYGGNALQLLLKRGVLQYRFLVFRRR